MAEGDMTKDEGEGQMVVETKKWVDPKAAKKLASVRDVLLEAIQLFNEAFNAYSQTDDGLHKRLARKAITQIFPDFVSWKRTCRLLNDRKSCRKHRILYGLYVSLGIPMWDWINCEWDHRNTDRIYTVTDLARAADEKLHGCEWKKVPG